MAQITKEELGEDCRAVVERIFEEEYATLEKIATSLKKTLSFSSVKELLILLIKNQFVTFNVQENKKIIYQVNKVHILGFLRHPIYLELIEKKYGKLERLIM